MGQMRAFLAVLVLAATGVHHTAAGMATAQRALLSHTDLGSRWLAGTTPKKAGSLSCTGGTSQVRGVVEIGAAVTPTYRLSASGPFVSESSFVYNSAAAAGRYFRQAAQPNLSSCLVQMLTGGNTNQAVAFIPGTPEPLPTPRLPAAVVAYRIDGQAVATAQKVLVYVDVVVAQRGAAIVEIAYSSFSQPLRAVEEQRIERAAVARLGSL